MGVVRVFVVGLSVGVASTVAHAQSPDLPPEIDGDVVVSPAGIFSTTLGGHEEAAVLGDDTMVFGTVTISGFHTADFQGSDAVSTALRSEFVADGVIIRDNPGLTSLAGLDNLDVYDSIEIIDNPLLQNLSGLATTDYTLDSMFQTLNIHGNPVLTDLSHLSSWTLDHGNDVIDVQIVGNGHLTSLAGLGFVASVHSLTIENNTLLSSLGALDTLQCARSAVTVTGNTALPACTVQSFTDRLDAASATCGGLTPTVTHDLTTTHDCAVVNTNCTGDLTLDASGLYLGSSQIHEALACQHLDGSATISGVHDLTQLAELQSLTGDLTLDQTLVTNFVDLSALESVGGVLTVSANADLQQLQGLHNLTSVHATRSCPGWTRTWSL